MIDFGIRPLQGRKSSLYVNIPVVWSRSTGAEKGDLIRILMSEDGYLVIGLAYQENKSLGKGKQAPTSTLLPRSPAPHPEEAMPGE